MSGHKRSIVAAETENLRRLSQTDMAVRFVKAGLKELSQRLDHRARLQQVREIQEKEEANQQLIQALDEIDEVFGQMEGETRSALVKQEEQFYQHMQQFSQFVGEANDQQLEEMNEQFQSILAEVVEHHEDDLNLLSGQLESMVTDQCELALNTQKWIDAASTLYQNASSDPLILAAYPETLEYSTDILIQALDNQQSGYSEAALISAQNVYRELSRVRLLSTQLSNQHAALSRILLSKIDLLDQEIELNQQVQAIDLQGNPLEMEIWVDDWVGGGLTELKHEIFRARTLLAKPASIQVIKKVNTILKQHLPRWHERLKDIVYQARAEVLNSQLRMNIALMVVKSLSTQGYRLEASQYNDEDMRSGYRAQLTDPEGSRVMVLVDAKDGQPEAAELNLFTQDADKRTPHELRQRSLEIQRSLKQAGLHVGELSPVDSGIIPSPTHQTRVKRVQRHEIPAQASDER